MELLRYSDPVDPAELEGVHNQLQEELNSIFPPKKIVRNDREMTQLVSMVPGARVDVIKLDERVTELLKTEKAKESGICEYRESIFSECFDEIIRQVYIDLQPRGELLNLIKKEINWTIEAYQSLYESSMAHGIRNAIRKEQMKSELAAENAALEKEKEDLESKVEELKKRMAELREKDSEETMEREREHSKVVDQLRGDIKSLRSKLEELLSPVYA